MINLFASVKLPAILVQEILCSLTTYYLINRVCCTGVDQRMICPLGYIDFDSKSVTMHDCIFDSSIMSEIKFVKCEYVLFFGSHIKITIVLFMLSCSRVARLKRVAKEDSFVSK